MRVTDLTKRKAVNNQISRNSEKLQDVMVGISSGKKLNKISDDPVASTKVQGYKSSIQFSDAISRNLIENKAWLTDMETAIAHISDMLEETKNLALQAGNSTADAQYREEVSNEIDEMLNDMVDMGNSKRGKLFLFSGTKTFTKPLEKQTPYEDVEADIPLMFKSQNKFIPVDRNKELSELIYQLAVQGANGSGEDKSFYQGIMDEAAAVGTAVKNLFSTFKLELILSDDQGKEFPIQIDMAADDTVMDLIDKVNLAAAEEELNTEDSNSPTGFKAKVLAQMGTDDSVYFSPAKGYHLKFGGQTSEEIKKILNLGIIGGEEKDFGMNSGLTNLSESAQTEFNAFFEGYTDQKYTIKVVKGGKYGDAECIISDDGGKTWSRRMAINKRMDVYNPTGKAGNQVTLNFRDGISPYFIEGIEFRFDGNEVVEYKGNEQVKEVTIDERVKIPLDITAETIFYKTGRNTINIFDILNRLKAAAAANDQVAITKSIGDLRTAQEQVFSQRAKIGILIQQMDDSESRLEEKRFANHVGISSFEDVDLPKAITEMKVAENRHKVSLRSGADLIQPGLIEFLK